MRIASYNIRKAVGLDWRRDPGRVIDVLAEIGADVVVLQEADKRLGGRAGVLPLDRIEQELGYRVADVSVRTDSHGWHGNVILCRRNRLILGAERIAIPALEPRGAVSVRLHDPEIQIIGAHLGLTPGMRQKQLDVLAGYMHGLQAPVILAGDLNERRPRLAAFGDGFDVVTPGPTFHAARPRASLDRFVLTHGLRCLSAHVHGSDLARQASDHLPVVIDIALPPG